MAASIPLQPVIPTPNSCHPALFYLATLAPQSRRAMRGSLDTVAAELTGGLATHRTCPWPALRYPHTRWVRAKLLETYKPATVNRHLAGLRGVLKQCFRLGLMTADEYQRAVEIRHVRAAPRKRGIKADEIQALFTSCDEESGPVATRDAAVLALLYGAGMRRSEMVALALGDYDGATVSVRGENANARIMPVSAGVCERLDAWIELRGHKPGPFLLQFNRNAEVVFKGISPQSVMLTCYRRANAAGIDRFSPHDLRRSFMQDLLDAGADIVAVRHLTGNSYLKAGLCGASRSLG